MDPKPKVHQQGVALRLAAANRLAPPGGSSLSTFETVVKLPVDHQFCETPQRLSGTGSHHQLAQSTVFFNLQQGGLTPNLK